MAGRRPIAAAGSHDDFHSRTGGRPTFLDYDLHFTAAVDLVLKETSLGGFCPRVLKSPQTVVSSPKGKVELKGPNPLDPLSAWPDEGWYDFTIPMEGGGQAGIAVVNHRDNPPTRWFNLPKMGMLNPCITTHGAVPLKAGKTLRLRYTVKWSMTARAGIALEFTRVLTQPHRIQRGNHETQIDSYQWTVGFGLRDLQCAAEANSSPSRREPMAVTPELLDQAFVSLKGFDVKPGSPAPQPQEISGEKKSPYALYRLKYDQQLSDWQGVIELAAAQTQPDAARRAELEQRFLALCKPALSKAAQKYICRQLGMIVTDRAVPAMAPLLDDADLRTWRGLFWSKFRGPLRIGCCWRSCKPPRRPRRSGLSPP